MGKKVVEYRLIENFPGYGRKGDRVQMIMAIGDLWIVTNGSKQFCIEKNKLSICPAFQQQEVQT